MTPPSTESLVVVVTVLEGWARELKVRPTKTSPGAGNDAFLRKFWFHGTTVTRPPVRAQLRGVVVDACLATLTFGAQSFLFRGLRTNRRTSALVRLTTAPEQTLELMEDGNLPAPTQRRAC